MAAPILRVGPDGACCGEFASLRALHQRWLRDLRRATSRLRVHRLALRAPAPRAAARPADAAALPGPQPPPQPPARRWDWPMEPAYKRVLKRATRRRRLRHADRAPARRDRRCAGPHDEHARRPEPGHGAAGARAAPPRDPLRATVLARLSPQKRLVHAVAAWERVVAALPGARLDIYGDGQRARRRRGGDRRARAGRRGRAARLRPARARRALDVERAPADERLRGLPALHARGDGPRLPGRQLRHPVRAARADHGRRRRLRRRRRRRRRARRAGGRAAPRRRSWSRG